MGNVQLSQHFRYNEFKCSCGGKLTGCRKVIINMRLINKLEKLRKAYYPNGLRIVSSYRCRLRNEQVGGAQFSRHRTGEAVDIVPVVNWKEMKKLELFTGIGYNTETGLVSHVDVREGDPDNPVIWTYTNGKTDTPNRHRR